MVYLLCCFYLYIGDVVENIKIKVVNGAENKEAQELFFKLGCYWDLGSGKHLEFVTTHDSHYPRFMHTNEFGRIFYCAEHNSGDLKTLPELKDMVVLKRNDRNDRTHTDQDNWSWYVSSNGTGYVFGAGNANGLHQWDESSLNMVDLKPIEKKMKEYLKKIGNNEYMLMNGAGYSGQDNWIEVPEGAFTYKKNMRFYNEDGSKFYNSSGCWTGSQSSEHYNVLWQRNTEPKQAEFLVKTDSGYILQVLDENAGGDGMVRVPDGATTYVDVHQFGEHGYCFYNFTNTPPLVFADNAWTDFSKNYPTLESLVKSGDEVLWQRDQSLNSKFETVEQISPEDVVKTDLPDFNIGGIYLGPDIGIDSQVKSLGMCRSEINHRTAQAFNQIKGTKNLINEDDVRLISELIELVKTHGVSNVSEMPS